MSTTKREIVTVNIEDLRPHPLQQEIYGETTVDDAFVQSIQRTGVLQMPVIKKTDDDDFGYVIISGHRRVEAARLAELDKIECEIRTYDTSEDEEYDFLTANKTREKNITQILAEIKRYKQISRQNLSIEFSKALAIADYKNNDASAQLNHLSGLSNKEIARITGVSYSTLKAYVCIFDEEYRNEVIEEFVGWGMSKKAATFSVNELWNSVGERVKSGEIGLRSAYAGLLDAKRDAIQRLDAKNNVKTPKAKKEKSAKLDAPKEAVAERRSGVPLNEFVYAYEFVSNHKEANGVKWLTEHGSDVAELMVQWAALTNGTK